MPVKTLFHIICLLLIGQNVAGQISFCPDDPPNNPWLADSPYPIYHRNSYAQASTCIPGIQPGDSVAVKLRRDITGGTSPWVYLSEKYPDGERTLLYSNSTHVFKFIDNGTGLVAVDSLRLDFNTLGSNGYNHLLTKNKIWFSYEPTYDPANDQYSRLFKFTDADTTDAYSNIIALDTLNFGDYGINRVNMYNLNYDGQIVWYSEKDPERNVAYAGVIDQNFTMLDILEFATLPNERVNHNSISVDENNSFYIVTSHRLIQFAWTGTELTIGWEAMYDFVNDGPTGNFAYGSGTTPTLMGWGAGNDQLVVVADGHANNNLVAFWRELPEDWTGIPGRPLHFADAIPIPNAQSFSNLFQSIENSPTAYGYEIAIAQFNGFLGYGCDNNKGVSKFLWNEDSNRFQLEWTNDTVNMNGVLAYSSGSNLLYGTGKEIDCVYYYYGLDWDSGSLNLKLQLGPEEDFPDDPFYDQGVNHIIDEDGSIYFSGSRSLIKLERIVLEEDASPDGNEEDEDIAENPESSGFLVYPNPTSDQVYFQNINLDEYIVELFSLNGRFLGNLNSIDNRTISMATFPDGIYYLVLRNDISKLEWKIIKTSP